VAYSFSASIIPPAALWDALPWFDFPPRDWLTLIFQAIMTHILLYAFEPQYGGLQRRISMTKTGSFYDFSPTRKCNIWPWDQHLRQWARSRRKFISNRYASCNWFFESTLTLCSAFVTCRTCNCYRTHHRYYSSSTLILAILTDPCLLHLECLDFAFASHSLPIMFTDFNHPQVHF